MKGIILKSIALIVILAFAAVLVPQPAHAQAVGCQAAQDACDIAQIVAIVVCVIRPDNCDFANTVAGAICAWADAVCAANP